MSADQPERRYIIWGADHAAYGPVELPTLVDWIKDSRVTADSWIYSEGTDVWQRADQMSGLKQHFAAEPLVTNLPDATGAGAPASGLRPGALRRVKILAELTTDQLSRFVGFMEVQQVAQWTEIVHQDTTGDAMYLVLDGELRVRLIIGGKETTLATLGIGEFFGEISLFDHGPRSADVLANKDSTLLRISSAAFDKLVREAPDLAAPILLAIGKTLCARIRLDNKRYRDSVAFARAVAD